MALTRPGVRIPSGPPPRWFSAYGVRRGRLPLILLAIYDDYASLPPAVKTKIETVIEPPDPEAWVKTPIHALGDRTFLDTYNSDDGETAANAYFASVEAFEREQAGQGGQLAGQSELASNTTPEDLGAELQFDSSDLDTNRAGLISPSQRLRLWHRDELQMGGAGASMVAGVAFNVALVTGLMGPIHGKGAGTGIALMIIGGGVGWASWRLWLDLSSGKVASLDGNLTTTTTSTRSGNNYFFVIGGKRFKVSRLAWAGVHEGWRRVYYLPKSGTLLSLEPPK